MTLTFSRLALLGACLLYGQLGRLGEPDPSSLPTAWVVAVKGIGFLLATVALAGSLRQAPAASR